MGILINFGLTGIGIQRRHEFGHQGMPKIVQIDLIFCTIFKYGDKGQFFTFMRDYFMNSGVEKLPQYRQQVKAIKSKVRAQEKASSERQIKNLESDLLKKTQQYNKLYNDTIEIRNLAYAVRNLKQVDFKKLEEI